MEKLLFRSLPVWLVLLLLILMIPVLIAFGLVVRMTTQGNDKFGVLGEMSVLLADTPVMVDYMMSGDDRMRARFQGRFDARRSWTLTPNAALEGYLLLSRYDGDERRHEISLVDLSDASTVARWPVDADALFENIPLTSLQITPENMNTGHFRAIHPIALPDGDILIKDHWSPLLRMGPCGERRWDSGARLFHHSTETDRDGNFWIPSHKEPSELHHVPEDFHDDVIAKVSPDGEILFERSLIAAMIEHGYMPMFFTVGTYMNDPAHLNDIQPVLEDGPHWKTGDLFLSLRKKSLIVLYRPSTDEIIWTKMGPWMGQHDVDIVNDHTIAVFSNNAYDAGRGGYVLGSNEVLYYDFDTDMVSSPFKDAMNNLEITALFEGLFDLLPSGHLMVEEENTGRIVVLAPDGTLTAEYVNRADDGRLYRMGWSRYMDRATGDALRDTMATINCN